MAVSWQLSPRVLSSDVVFPGGFSTSKVCGLQFNFNRFIIMSRCPHDLRGFDSNFHTSRLPSQHTLAL